MENKYGYATEIEGIKIYRGKYKHFKGKEYELLEMATDVDTNELLIIYKALYDDFKIWARKAEEFFSEVDTEKYPNVKQKYRFEYIGD